MVIFTYLYPTKKKTKTKTKNQMSMHVNIVIDTERILTEAFCATLNQKNLMIEKAHTTRVPH